MNRREVLGRIVTGVTGLFMARGGLSMPQRPTDPVSGTTLSTPTGVPPGQHAVKPLPFAPKTLRGLSERLVVSYGAAALAA